MKKFLLSACLGMAAVSILPAGVMAQAGVDIVYRDATFGRINIVDSEKDIPITHFIYDLSGNLIWQGDDIADLKSIGFKGIVIVKSISGKESKTKKIMLN